MNSKHFTNKASSALYSAIKNNNLREIEYLLDIGKANPNYVKGGKSCLYEALEQENYQVLNLLLKYGAKAELTAYNTSLLPFSSYSPLEIAMGAKEDMPVQIEAAKLLIKHGADYGGIQTYNLSETEKQELNLAREKYLAEGKEIADKFFESKAIGQKITANQLIHTLTFEEFQDKYGSDNYHKTLANYQLYKYNAKERSETPIYNTSSIPYQIEKVLQETYQLDTNKSVFEKLLDGLKSFMGYRYYEDAATYQIHTNYKQIENLISIHNEQEQPFQNNSLRNIENVTLSGENTEIDYLNYNI